jgi:hypothetical protein
MFIIIGADGKEYGPVATDKVRDWLAAGRANFQTRARRDGETDWKTLADFEEFVIPSDSSPPPIPSASSPAASTSLAPTGPVDAKAYADDLIARSAPLDVFEMLGRSFKLWTSNFWPLVGITLLVLVIQAIAGMVPIIGMLSGFLLNGVFYGGLYYYYLGKVRGEPREIGDAFAGFSKAFVPLMLTTLITTLITIAVFIPFFFPLLAVVIRVTMPALGGIALGAIFLGSLLLIYLSISWVFAFALVIDKGLGPWTAMEVSRRVVGRQWFRVFFVVLFGAILSALGFIAFVVGICFTLPLAFGAVISAYEELCNPPPRV